MTESTSAVDVVERLRILDAKRAPLGWEAAAEIERLRTALATAEQERDEARANLMPVCPFRNPTFDIRPDEPCPICGMLGHLDAEEKCIEGRYLRALKSDAGKDSGERP